MAYFKDQIADALSNQADRVYTLTATVDGVDQPPSAADLAKDAEWVAEEDVRKWSISVDSH